MYLPSVHPDTGRLARLTMIPLQARRMRLHPATAPDVAWLCGVLDRISRPFHTRVRRTGRLTLEAVPDSRG